MNIGDVVAVLPPFDGWYIGEFTVVQITHADDGGEVVYLDGVESAFAPSYLTLIESKVT